MKRSITDWDGVTNVLSSSVQLGDEKKASLMSIALGCNQDTSLSLTVINISVGLAEALSQALYTLEELYLYNNSTNIGDIGEVLARALHHNSTLKVLYLPNNRISDAGTKALAQALHHNSTLKKLYLSNNTISDTGAIALAQALHHNSTLQILFLSHSRIGHDGAVALAQALHHNSTLQILSLSHSNISDDGAVALAQALHHNSTLERLELSHNDAINKEGTYQLVQALTVNTSINTRDSRHASGLRLPGRCEEYATQCTQYNTVKDRIEFDNKIYLTSMREHYTMEQ